MRLVKVLAWVGLVGIIGCGGSETPAPTAAAKAAPSEAQPQDPIAAMAEEFLQAVVQGDTQRATRCLTPEAIAQFEASAQGFASPEIGAPKFSIGEVRRLGEGRAAVQCALQDEQGQAEMLCLLKQSAPGWRVSGVAYEAAPNQPPVILNFEQLEPPAPATPAVRSFVGQPAGTLPAAAPRTAAEASLGQRR